MQLLCQIFIESFFWPDSWTHYETSELVYKLTNLSFLAKSDPITELVISDVNDKIIRKMMQKVTIMTYFG